MSDIATLRTVLFETLEKLRDEKNPMDIERAKIINDTAQTIINSAKVEVDFCRTTGQTSTTGFLPALPAPGATPAQQQTATGTKTITQVPGASITQHRLR